MTMAERWAKAVVLVWLTMMGVGLVLMMMGLISLMVTVVQMMNLM
jgi:hypothetical protein